MSMKITRYKITENTSPFTPLEGAVTWNGGGEYVYLPASGPGSGVGTQIANETGESPYYLTKGAFEDRIAVYGLIGDPPWL